MRLLATSLFVIALTSCADSTGVAGLRLTMSVDQTQVARDGAVAVSLTATNLSSRAITVYAPESYGICLRAFRVYDAHRREVNTFEALCALASLLAPQPIELAPGASVTAHDSWEPGRSTLDGEPIPAGTYRLIGHYHAGDRIALSGAKTITVTQ